MPDLVFATKGTAAVLRAQQQMAEEAKKLGAEFKKDAAEADKLARAARNIYESTKTPQEQSLQRIRTLREAMIKGVAPPESLAALQRLKEQHHVTFSAARQDITRSNLSLKELETTQKKAFDTSGIKSFGKGVAAVAAGPVAALAAAMSQISTDYAKFADSDKASIAGEGGLAQFAKSDAEFQDYLAESRAEFAMGVGRDRNTAAQALAGMLGADISSRQDRLTLMRMQASGALGNSGDVARSAKTLQSTFGGEVTPYIDMAIGAGDIAPNGATELLIASSKSALGAKSLRMDAGQVVAATAALSQGVGSEAEAATYLSAFLKSLDKAGGFEGKSIPQAVREITARVAAGEDVRGDTLLGGREEALKAYRYFANEAGMQTFNRAIGGVVRGVREEAGMDTLMRAESADPNLRAARFAIIQEQQREIANQEKAAFTNINQGLREDLREQADRMGWFPQILNRAAIAISSGDHPLSGLNPIPYLDTPEGTARSLSANGPSQSDSPAQREAREIIKSIDAQREIAKKQLKVLEEMKNMANNGGIFISNE